MSIIDIIEIIFIACVLIVGIGYIIKIAIFDEK